MSSAKLVPWKYIAIALVSLALAFLVSRFAVPQPSAASGDAPGAVPARLLSGPADPTDAPSAAAEEIVYVCGAVRKPGVYQLRAGARVADALARAGGATTQAEVEQLNLAELLADGMKIVVPRKGQAAIASSPIEAESQTAIVAGAATRRPHRTHGAGGRHKLAPGQTLDVNAASEQELMALPGVGPGLARRIVEYRTTNGPFQTVDDLQNVSGIGPSKFDKMAPYIRL